MTEPELRFPPPRGVRARGSHTAETIVCLLLLLPLVLVTLYTSFRAVTAWAASLSSVTVPGRIVTLHAGVPGALSFRMETLFRWGRRSVRLEDEISESEYNSLRKNQILPVHVWASAPGISAIVSVPGRAPARVAWGRAERALAWDLALLVFLVLIWYVRRNRERLIRDGSAAVATVRARVEGPLGPAILYDFVPLERPGTLPIPGRQSVSPQEWALVEPGDRLTALYDPQSPTRNQLYRFSGYVAVSPGHGEGPREGHREGPREGHEVGDISPADRVETDAAASDAKRTEGVPGDRATAPTGSDGGARIWLDR